MLLADVRVGVWGLNYLPTVASPWQKSIIVLVPVRKLCHESRRQLRDRIDSEEKGQI